MWEDPIVNETRAARKELVQEFGDDLDALWDHLQEVQKRYQDRVVTGEPKTPITVRRKVS
jgi:RNAse (barnase) inhibitor barstar